MEKSEYNKYHRDYNKRPKARERIRKYMLSYHKEHKEKKQSAYVKFRLKTRLFLDNYLKTHPCIDCGNTDARVLEFDHVRGEKNKNVTALIGSGMPTILKEISKCEIRCSNCHKIRHFIDTGDPVKLI